MKKKIIIPISIVVLIIIFIVSFSMCSSSNSQDYYENDDFSETDGFTALPILQRIMKLKTISVL